MVGGSPSPEGLRPSDYIDAKLWCCFVERRVSHMDILGLIAVLSFGLTCFGIGYSFGKDSNKTQQ